MAISQTTVGTQQILVIQKRILVDAFSRAKSRDPVPECLDIKKA
jgi:hypothetical protein